MKRALDVAGALTGLCALAPLLGLIAILIALDSPGAVLYLQPRLGRHGRVFRLVKFRSMCQGAEQALEQLLHDPAIRAEWECRQKLRGDPRVTATGRWLRRFGLDELPQLWNVLQGDMSLVGPRPILPSQREMYGSAFAEYARVAPGITGMWQVCGRNALPFASRPALDRLYVRRWSIRLDVEIMLKTVGTVLRQQDLS